jgi:xanthine dehydrogenase YagT iron-sulfur-binding subunit
MTKKPEDPLQLTRRGFLLGTGVTAAITSVTSLEGCRPAQTPSVPITVLGPGPVAVALRVNGVERKVQIEPRTMLVEVLREHLDLTGTKVGCNRGSCSACTVWIDETPVNSCMTFALDAVGHEITTIEGLAQGETLHPLQQAFIDQDAMQCGFCTPGMIMSGAALLKKNAHPTLDDVRAATCGNLCRCGVHAQVFEATLAAATKKGA